MDPNRSYPGSRKPSGGSFLNTPDSDWFSQRLYGTLLVISIAFAVLVIRLLHLQLIEGKEYRRLSEINSIRLQSIDAPRGLILDSHGKLLVDNRPAFDLKIVLKDARPVEKTIAKLSRYTGIDRQELMDKIASGKNRSSIKPFLLKSDIGRDAMAAVEVHNWDLPGILVQVSPKRHYLHKGFAAHVLGYMGEINASELQKEHFRDLRAGDYIGKFGLEKTYETVLRGKRGGRQVEVNAAGQTVRILKTVPAQPGSNLILTIDYNLQTLAESLMDGKAGAVVALDPRNGKILAMVSSPAFDQNMFISGMSREQWKALVANPNHPLENKAIQAEYPPASTFKIVTAIAGLEEGLIDETTTVHCPGYYRFGNRTYRCWKHAGHGTMNVVQALSQSCDVFFYQLGQQLGVDRIAEYAKRLGLGKVTGIELDHESRGLMPTEAWKLRRFGQPWQKGETLSVAIGQGFDLVTPLQMASLIAAVGNGGRLYRPLLVDLIKTAEGAVVEKSRSELTGNVEISEKTFALVHKGLWSVVNDLKGTAHASRLKWVEFAGKTGTAQVIGRSGDGNNENDMADQYKPHAWFVAYAPVDDPLIAVAVMVEHGEHGSSAAAPIAKQLIAARLAPENKNRPVVADPEKNP